MAEWRVRLAMGQKNEQDQTTFMDLLDGNGRGHRWGMNPVSRGKWHEFGVGYCGEAKKMRGFNNVWEGEGARTHTPGSRSVMRVCFPNVTK